MNFLLYILLHSHI